MKDAGEYFTCALCEGVFLRGRSDEEAWDEFVKDFPEAKKEDCEILCGFCSNLVMG